MPFVAPRKTHRFRLQLHATLPRFSSRSQSLRQAVKTVRDTAHRSDCQWYNLKQNSYNRVAKIQAQSVRLRVGLHSHTRRRVQLLLLARVRIYYVRS